MPCRLLFKLRNKCLERFEPRDSGHGLNPQHVQDRHEPGISDLLSKGARFVDSPRGSLHRFGNLGLHLCIGDFVCPLRMSGASQNFPVDVVSQDAPEAFNPTVVF
jgi:hypothetical protein